MVSLSFVAHLGVLLCLHVVLLVSLNLTAGYCGMLSVAHAVFFGLGAYAGAHAAMSITPELAVPLLAGLVVAAAGAAALGPWLVRLHSDYFVLATFAVQVVAFELFVNIETLTGGVNGLSAIPPVQLFGWTLKTAPSMFLLSALWAAAAIAVAVMVDRSPLRRLMVGLREDEVYMATLGVDVVAGKTAVFVAGAAMAGATGALYAQYATFIAPVDFTVFAGIMWLVALTLGGQGTASGPVIGAALLIVLPEALRYVGVPGPLVGNVRQILIGCVFLGILLWRPLGILGATKSNERVYD